MLPTGRQSLARRVTGSFALWRSLLVGQRSMKDILPPLAFPQCQISSNAPVLYFEIGSKQAVGQAS
jgi:hypothetical protein